MKKDMELERILDLARACREGMNVRFSLELAGCGSLCFSFFCPFYRRGEGVPGFRHDFYGVFVGRYGYYCVFPGETIELDHLRSNGVKDYFFANNISLFVKAFIKYAHGQIEKNSFLAEIEELIHYG